MGECCHPRGGLGPLNRVTRSTATSIITRMGTTWTGPPLFDTWISGPLLPEMPCWLKSVGKHGPRGCPPRKMRFRWRLVHDFCIDELIIAWIQEWFATRSKIGHRTATTAM